MSLSNLSITKTLFLIKSILPFDASNKSSSISVIFLPVYSVSESDVASSIIIGILYNLEILFNISVLPVPVEP